MRRFLSVLAALACAATTVLLVPSAHAAPLPVSGRLVDAYTGDPVAGAAVRLRRATGGVPGRPVDYAQTNARGRFVLTPDAPGQPFYVQVRAGRYQGGYVGGGSTVYVQPNPGATHAPGTAIGRIRALPAFVRGRVVDAASGAPVRGALVSARDVLDRWVIFHTVRTDARGRFHLTRIAEEEIALRVQGRRVGYENGFRGCGGGVVPTWGEACSASTGALGRVRLDRRP
jgi:5-hydroxyisourate hydrolase-like protein (transthyretin family)